MSVFPEDAAVYLENMAAAPVYPVDDLRFSTEGDVVALPYISTAL